MFIHFEFLNKQREKTELIVTTPKEALNMASLFEASDAVVAWKMLSHKPEDFGAAPFSSPMWKKLRYTYRPEDYDLEPKDFGSGDTEEQVELSYRKSDSKVVRIAVPFSIAHDVASAYENDPEVVSWCCESPAPTYSKFINKLSGPLHKIKFQRY